MRFLKFDLYNGGHVGFFNNLMSLELAVGLSVLSNRRLLFSEPRHGIYNSEKRLKLFDLVDLFYPHQIGRFGSLRSALLPDLHGARLVSADLLERHDAAIIATCNDSTLGYYSYTLPFDERIVYACNHLIVIKEQYRRIARFIAGQLQKQHGRFASVHIRRADFLRDHDQSATVTGDEICYNIRCHVPPGCLLLVHSDEPDEKYFRPILECFPNHMMIDSVLCRELLPNTFDSAEIGLISALVAAESDIFLGTMFSTFTGYIQRRRLLNGKPGGFLYLYNQRPECLAFQDGRILETGTTGPTWERISMSDELKSICFWWREWPESICSRQEFSGQEYGSQDHSIALRGEE
jgi:hypothetical protein